MTYCKSIRGGAPGPAITPINRSRHKLDTALSRMLNNVLNKLITIKIFIAIKKSLFAEDTRACDADCETDIKRIFNIEGVNIEEICEYSKEAMDEFQGLDDILGLSAEQHSRVHQEQELELTSAVHQQLSYLTDLLQDSDSSRDMFYRAYDLILEIEQNILKFNQTAKILNPLNPFEQNNLISLIQTTFDIIQPVIQPYIQFMRQKRNAKILSEFHSSIAAEAAISPEVSSRQRQKLRDRRDKRREQEEMGRPETSLNPYIPPGFDPPPGDIADLHDDPFYDAPSIEYELNYPEIRRRRGGKSRKKNNSMRMVNPHKTHKQHKQHKKTKRNNKKQSTRRRRNTLHAR